MTSMIQSAEARAVTFAAPLLLSRFRRTNIIQTVISLLGQSRGRHFSSAIFSWKVSTKITCHTVQKVAFRSSNILSKGSCAVTKPRFPKRDEILNYLRVHPSTANPYLYEKKILERVADYFSNRSFIREEIEIEKGVFECLFPLIKELELPKIALMPIHDSMVRALKDCLMNSTKGKGPL